MAQIFGHRVGQKAVGEAPFTAVEHIHHRNVGQLSALVTFKQFHQSEFPGLCFVIRVNCRGCTAQQGLGAMQMSQHDGGIAGIIPWRRVILLVAGLMLLVNHHKANLGKGQEHRRPHAENHHWLVAVQQFAPDVHALGIGELGMIHQQAVAKDFPQTVGELCGETYLRHQIKYLMTRLKGRQYSMTVNLGLAAAGNAAQEHNVLFAPLLVNLPQCLALQGT